MPEWCNQRRHSESLECVGRFVVFLTDLKDKRV